MPLLDPYFATRRRLKVGLTIAGFLGGATFGLAMTRLGKIVAEAPPATLGNYAWNAAVFGVMAAIVSPMISWSTLRRVPLWRTIVEPLAYAVAGATAAVLFSVPVLILVLPPLGLAFGFKRLEQRYRVPRSLPEETSGS
jgi:MFS family permease